MAEIEHTADTSKTADSTGAPENATTSPTTPTLSAAEFAHPAAQKWMSDDKKRFAIETVSRVVAATAWTVVDTWVGQALRDKYVTYDFKKGPDGEILPFDQKNIRFNDQKFRYDEAVRKNPDSKDRNRVVGSDAHAVILNTIQGMARFIDHNAVGRAFTLQNPFKDKDGDHSHRTWASGGANFTTGANYVNRTLPFYMMAATHQVVKRAILAFDPNENQECRKVNAETGELEGYDWKKVPQHFLRGATHVLFKNAGEDIIADGFFYLLSRELMMKVANRIPLDGYGRELNAKLKEFKEQGSPVLNAAGKPVDGEYELRMYSDRARFNLDKDTGLPKTNDKGVFAANYHKGLHDFVAGTPLDDLLGAQAGTNTAPGRHGLEQKRVDDGLNTRYRPARLDARKDPGSPVIIPADAAPLEHATVGGQTYNIVNPALGRGGHLKRANPHHYAADTNVGFALGYNGLPLVSPIHGGSIPFSKMYDHAERGLTRAASIGTRSIANLYEKLSHKEAFAARSEETSPADSGGLLSKVKDSIAEAKAELHEKEPPKEKKGNWLYNLGQFYYVNAVTSARVMTTSAPIFSFTRHYTDNQWNLDLDENMQAIKSGQMKNPYEIAGTLYGKGVHSVGDQLNKVFAAEGVHKRMDTFGLVDRSPTEGPEGEGSNIFGTRVASAIGSYTPYITGISPCPIQVGPIPINGKGPMRAAMDTPEKTKRLEENYEKLVHKAPVFLKKAMGLKDPIDITLAREMRDQRDHGAQIA